MKSLEAELKRANQHVQSLEHRLAMANSEVRQLPTYSNGQSERKRKNAEQAIRECEKDLPGAREYAAKVSTSYAEALKSQSNQDIKALRDLVSTQQQQLTGQQQLLQQTQQQQQQLLKQMQEMMGMMMQQQKTGQHDDCTMSTQPSFFQGSGAK